MPRTEHRNPTELAPLELRESPRDVSGRALEDALAEDQSWRAVRRARWEQRITAFRATLENGSQGLIWVSGLSVVVLAVSSVLIPLVPSWAEHPAVTPVFLGAATCILLPGMLASMLDWAAAVALNWLRTLARRNEVDL